MTIKSDLMATPNGSRKPDDYPFLPDSCAKSRRTASFCAGASSYGYDMRLADDGFRVFSSVHRHEIDPKHFDEGSLIEPHREPPTTARNIICCRRIITVSASRSKPLKCRAT